MNTGATFDSTGHYRYNLWREWNEGPRLVFVMLNPSTANETKNDPTIRRCIGFAQAWGYGAVEVVNLFAYRSTRPEQLSRVADPIGPENDRYLLAAQERAQMLLFAWGNQGVLQQRHQAVLKLLRPRFQSCKPSYELGYCLGMTQVGQPRHPLYVRSETAPIPYQWAQAKTGS
ncbi:DUF1643 domain-containing protein [Leptolyngbya sp. FACHB-261]|uniref:DUF1643 domain-containing protein n=1 Tax=Leptolyngbya sp. FACHB-261 TaxID=2692806 RepID=UPI001689850C|nr:DUF1643 domain-containing protein [Leptolyngbya sp. FACHB-261]MBD2102006.1 DUF1643 domain-containing protein [Leptolyngbya sp. FACHB-261]